MRGRMLEAMGGEEGCERLAREFYARVEKDAVLKPLFPGKSLHCATEEMAAFLVQFLGGDEEQTQKRWWLSLRESHGRFVIGEEQRRAWLVHMEGAIAVVPMEAGTRGALREFFAMGAAYVVRGESAGLEHGELAERWDEQMVLDRLMASIAAGRREEAEAIAPRFAGRPSVFVGVLARMVEKGWTEFVVGALEKQPELGRAKFGGRTLLHYACGAGSVAVVEALLRLGVSADVLDRGGHTPLYRVANECGTEAGPVLVRLLLKAGADVNACEGVTRARPLHMAARRGFVEVARALLEGGADLQARDKKGDTALERARNCRKEGVARLLEEWGGEGLE